MYQYNLGEITVQFPHDAYDVQINFMKKVIQALRNKSNALLESPTGTGKTLTLLCAALAWRQAFETRHRMENLKEPEVQYDELDKIKLEDAVSSSPDIENWKGEPPKIYYASRTHSQLTQVVKELKATVYKPKVCILGSREQLCVHKDVKEAVSNATRTAICRRKVATKGCNYHANLKNGRTALSKHTEIMDIEDIVQFGLLHRACPFYLSRETQVDADVILLPYQYLVDATARKAMNIDLCNSIVIFDEAHNLESCCAEATSFEITSTTLRTCVLEMKVCQQAADKSAGEGIAATFGILADTIDRLRIVIEEVELDLSDELIQSGAYMYELLNKADINCMSIGFLQQGIDSAISMLAGGASQTQNVALSAFSNALRMVFRSEYFDKNDNTLSMAHSQYYKVHVESIRQTGTSMQERKLSYWCFFPGLAMKDIVDLGVRCVILASGTLAPLSSFASELLLDFPVRLENSHVIESNQALIAVVKRGPMGNLLSSAYSTRGKSEYKMDLGLAIVNFSKFVPEGLLVFFPSYSLMTDCIKAWKSSSDQAKSIWDRINEQKEIFVEPKTKLEFNQAINGYYSKIKDPAFDGAIFLAVCRGKVSEGVDFADGRGRAVIVTGIPFANSKDPKIVHKMQFLNDALWKTGNANTSESISGSTWYSQQALRAVNQAIGRVIRHRKDFGAILLCDERFGETRTISKLSAWIRDYVKVYDTFGPAQKSLIDFFKVMKQSNPSAPEATRSDITVIEDRENVFPRKRIKIEIDDHDQSEPLVSRNSNPRTAMTALNDFSIISNSQLASAQSMDSAYFSQSSNSSAIEPFQPKATLEQAQEYSREMSTLGPEKFRQYKVLIRQYKRKEIEIEPFIEALFAIFIDENRLDLLKRFRIFLPRKHIKIFDRALNLQGEYMGQGTAVSNNSRVYVNSHDYMRQRNE